MLQGESAGRVDGLALGIDHEEADQAPFVGKLWLLSLGCTLGQFLNHDLFQDLPLEDHFLACRIESLVRLGKITSELGGIDLCPIRHCATFRACYPLLGSGGMPVQAYRVGSKISRGSGKFIFFFVVFQGLAR